MTKTLLLTFALLSISFTTFSKTLPQVPEGCFDEEVFCTTAEIIERDVYGELKDDVIQARVFVEVSYDDFDQQELVDLFFDFDSWDEYAQREGSKRIKFPGQSASQNMGPIRLDGQEIKRHYAHYEIRVPILGIYLTVRAVGYYKMVTPYEGAAISVEFENQKTGVYEVPGEEILIGGEGFKFTAGDFHVIDDEENEVYIVIFSADVRPSITIAPGLAKRPILGGFESILKGMLEL